MTEREQKLKAVDRLDIVSAYLTRDYGLAMFVNLYNAGDVCGYLRKETGPVNAADLERWVNICMGVAE